jgi:cell wall-associated NlpC family hydrolase
MVDVKRRQRAFALLLAAVIVSAACLLPQTAGADAITDKQAQANAIAAKIDELNHTIEHDAEAANEAQIQLTGLNQQVQDAQAKVAAAQAEHDKHEGELRDYAVNAYVHGTDEVSQQQATGSDPNDQGQREGYLTAASGNRQQLIDELRATQQDLNTQIGQLNDAKTAAEGKAQDLQNQQNAAQSAVSQQQALYTQAQGELATLVQQAQQRAAAEQQAAAEARARAAAAQAPAPVAGRGGGGNAAPPGGGGSAGSAPSGPPPAAKGGAAAAVAEAQRQLGKPYVWGAAGPNAFDCSGLTAWAWAAGGVSLPHFSGAQYASTTHISLSAIQPGDLIFYESPDQHVALYVGGGQIIHAPHAGAVVQYDSLYYWNTSMLASRP